MEVTYLVERSAMKANQSDKLTIKLHVQQKIKPQH